MKVTSLVEVLMAAHISQRVESPYKERGGIMLVAPPGQLKSTLIETALDTYHESIMLGDVNVQTLNAMHENLGSSIHSLAFPAFEKIYERNPQTANNIEGHFKALVAEGLSLASYEDQRMPGCYKARCLIIGGLPPAIYRERFARWTANGFHRRFIWCFFHFADPQILIKAIHEWKKIKFNNAVPIMPREVIYNVAKTESEQHYKMLKYQNGESIPLVLLNKIMAVLKWRYRDQPSMANKVMVDFAECLGRHPAELHI